MPCSRPTSLDACPAPPCSDMDAVLPTVLSPSLSDAPERSSHGRRRQAPWPLPFSCLRTSCAPIESDVTFPNPRCTFHTIFLVRTITGACHRHGRHGQAPWPLAFLRHKPPCPQPSRAPTSSPHTAPDAPFFRPRSPATNAAAGATVSSAAGVRGSATLYHLGPSYGCSGMRAC
jgi:hypothetical protein